MRRCVSRWSRRTSLKGFSHTFLFLGFATQGLRVVGEKIGDEVEPKDHHSRLRKVAHT